MKNTNNLISDVAHKTRFLRSPVQEIISTLEETINEYVMKGETVKFGCVEISSKTVAEKEGICPKNGEYYKTEEHKVPCVRIRPSFKKEYRERNDV